MLKRDITYEDFNGKTVTETFYFNISKPELIELEVEQKEGLSEMIKKIIDTEDKKKIIEQFKKIILISYGEVSEDGKRFTKSEEMREAFSQSAAYVSLFMELTTNENSASVFIKSVIPKELGEAVDKSAQAEQPVQSVQQLPQPAATETTPPATA